MNPVSSVLLLLGALVALLAGIGLLHRGAELHAGERQGLHGAVMQHRGDPPPLPLLADGQLRRQRLEPGLIVPQSSLLLVPLGDVPKDDVG